jgi:integrase
VKTHEARTARLPRSVADELGAYLTGRPHGPEGLVFTAPRRSSSLAASSRPSPPPTRPSPRSTAGAAAGGLRLYDLRHTAASLMIRDGASVKAVQKQLGHATASITLDVYGHLFPDELEALAGRLEHARSEALAGLARTQHGPAVVPLREGAGQ